MARAGITYAEVEKVAANLAAHGDNPTVDAVRAALGGTGSKSTIAPMLKRWKSAHQQQLPQAGVPPALLEAVKNVYEQIQQQADVLVQDAQAAAANVVAECHQQVADAQAAITELSGKRDLLESDFAQEKSRREQLEAEHRALQLASATAQAQSAGFLQRLADRQNEIENLNRQLLQSRSQFEHYQEAVAAQRASEREEAQQRCSRLEQDLSELRRTLTDAQKNLAQRETQLEQLGVHSAGLESKLGILRQTHQATLDEREQLGRELAAQSVACIELRAQIKDVMQAMSETSAELAVLQHQTPQLLASVQAQTDRADALQLENHLLMQEKARLEGRLDQLSQT